MPLPVFDLRKKSNTTTSIPLKQPAVTTSSVQVLDLTLSDGGEAIRASSPPLPSSTTNGTVAQEASTISSNGQTKKRNYDESSRDEVQTSHPKTIQEQIAEEREKQRRLRAQIEDAKTALATCKKINDTFRTAQVKNASESNGFGFNPR